jgi:urease accessory protein UreF
MPLGHTQGQSILFHLKPQIRATAARALAAGLDAPSFAPLVEIASMSHQRLSTRLFIS